MKNFIVFFTLCLIYLLALFLNQKLIWSFYLVFLVFILVSRQKLVFKPLNVLIILSLPLLWTILLSYNYTFYNNIKGLFYLSLPVIMIIIGYQIPKLIKFNLILIYIVYIGTILSSIYIAIVIYKVGFHAFLSPYGEARFVVGSGSPASILSLIISGYSKRYGFKIFKDNIQRSIFILINITGIYLFASRTYWVVLIIFLLFFNLKTILKHPVLFFFILCFGLILVSFFHFTTSEEITSTKSFIVKLTKTFSELKFSNFQTYRDINIHYRGYESYRAFMTYLEGTPLDLLFGYGLGKTIDLKASVYLAGSYWTVVPWIHNGYFFLLVKEGLLGLLFLVVFLFKVFKIGFRNMEKSNTEKRFMSLLIISCTFSLALTNFVICSMFTIEMTIILITVGVLIQTLNAKDSDGNERSAEKLQ
jgi:O-antigen ligase